MADQRNEPVPSQLRASNKDRQAVVDRLQNAFVEGRLQLHEYDERVALAYQALTYADLAGLFADLPADSPIAPPRPAAARDSVARDSAAKPVKPQVRHHGVIADMPLALQIIWTIWLCVLLINLTVWTIGLGSPGSHNFWPIWLLVPTSILVGVTIGVTNIRRARRAKQFRKNLKAARKRG